MSYRNFIEHDKYGTLWYSMTLRNWNGMGNSQEENLDMGPCVEAVLDEYSVAGCGSSPQEAVEAIVRHLVAYEAMEMDLPPRQDTQDGWFKRWRLGRLFKRWERDGTLNPVQ